MANTQEAKPSVASQFMAYLAPMLGRGAAPTQARARRTRTPLMVTASPAEIAAWNRAVTLRKNSRDHSRTYPNARLPSVHVSGQHPKFPKARAHKQANHPQRDAHGAYTVVGKEFKSLEYVEGTPVGYAVVPRRKWLAGISAQRGY